MNDLVEQLKPAFDASEEYRAGYDESFMNSWIAAQIKILREQRGLSQCELAEKIGTKQAGISRLENTGYTAWKVQTLARLARAFDVRLRISFEEFGTLSEELDRFGKEYLKRNSYPQDAIFHGESVSSLSQLSQKELNALSTGSGRLVQFANRNADSSAMKGTANGNNLDSFGEVTSVHRNGTTEFPRKDLHARTVQGLGDDVQVRKSPIGA